MHIFLSRTEKAALAKWQYRVEDNSITTEWMTPFWNWLVTLVPKNVAPNILSLAGFLCILYAYHLTSVFYDSGSSTVGCFAALLVFIYMNLDAIDGKHARVTMNSSPLGELFDHSCDNLSVVFAVLTLCNVMQISDVDIQWYLVQSAQIVFLNEHVRAYVHGVVTFDRWTGPGECLLMYITCMVLSSLGVFSVVNWVLPTGFLYAVFGYLISKIYYGLFFGTLIYQAVILTDVQKYSTRNGLMISMLVRFIPAIILRSYRGSADYEIDTYTVIAHGLIMAVLTGDMIVAKMAQRELHPLIPIMAMISLFDNFLCIVMAVMYYVVVLSEISFYLRVPLLDVKRVVFCNGVYDLCHEGHMNLFREAASRGTRLLVGVHNDADVASYKRVPTLTHEQRCATVAKCKWVDEVIPNCPLELTPEFIKKWGIDTVVCSEEYDDPGDKYYAAARNAGILEVLPRTEGISTSEIRKKVFDSVSTEQ